MSVIVGEHGLDKQGLLNSQGLWNRRGALIVGTIGGCAFVGFNYFYFEEMLAAWVLFTAVWLPLLTAAFLLVVLERALERGLDLRARHRQRVGELGGELGLRLQHVTGVARRLERGGDRGEAQGFEGNRNGAAICGLKSTPARWRHSPAHGP